MSTVAAQRRSLHERYKRLEGKALHLIFGQYGAGQHTTWPIRGLLTQLQRDVAGLADTVKANARDKLKDALALRNQLMALFPDGTTSARRHQFFMGIESQMIHILDINIAPPAPVQVAAETSKIVDEVVEAIKEDQKWGFDDLEIYFFEMNKWRERIRDLFQRAMADPSLMSVADFASSFAVREMCKVARSVVSMFPELFQETGWIKLEDFSIAFQKSVEAHMESEDTESEEADAGGHQGEKKEKETGAHTFPELMHFLTENWEIWSNYDHNFQRKSEVIPPIGGAIGDDVFRRTNYCMRCYLLKLLGSNKDIENQFAKHDLEGLCLIAVFLDTMLPLANDPELLKTVKRAVFARLVESTEQFLAMRKWWPPKDDHDFRSRVTHLTKMINQQTSIWELATMHTYADAMTFNLNDYVLSAMDPPGMFHAYQAYVMLGIEEEIPEDVRSKARAFVLRFEKYIFKDRVKPRTQAQWNASLKNWVYKQYTKNALANSIFHGKSFVLQILRADTYEGPGPELGINEEEGSDEWWQAIQDRAAEEFQLPSLIKPMDAIMTDWNTKNLKGLLFQVAHENWKAQKGKEKARAVLRKIPLKATYFPDV